MTRVCTMLFAFACTADAATFRGKPSVSLAEMSDEAAMHSIEVLKEKIRDFKAINPLFSTESCTTMYETKLKLGSAVPPTDFVTGCDQVCDAAKGIKEYWGSGDMATYACETMSTFGCVWSGTPPVKVSDIGC
eukprot:CAMPEP_0169110650 /NCGR_PEP_ID=MMETSP1015-20121227/26628_1 /TAXON_ID=342587 /ORGANISM="Karlodinium micrum, Strain CCMP2283" /LENGTH=132 /DNA_ID=CAMNT_0009172461 /DNA_START=73 /DNA_END=471 /DNA_ORIENTATION=+